VILLDSSVWIATFQRRDPIDLAAILDLDDIVTCLPVVQEVLQGFRDEGAFRIAQSSLLSFPIVESPLEQAVVLDAVTLYRTARRAGVTVRSSIDCLVAACALRHDLEVLHRDRDYPALARVSALRQRKV
jgi:predicted nucleic acid-binding protein